MVVGLTMGSIDQRGNATYTVGDLVKHTEESAMKPLILPFTGLLICAAIQAVSYPSGVKTTILSASTVMPQRIPNHVRLRVSVGVVARRTEW